MNLCKDDFDALVSQDKLMRKTNSKQQAVPDN